MKKKILMILKLPPPITGATVMNSYLYESKKLYEVFHTRYIIVRYVKTIQNMGKIRIYKLFKMFQVLFKLLIELILFRPDLVYFQISPYGIAFFRDSVFIKIVKIFKVKLLIHLHGKGISAYTERRPLFKKYYQSIFSNTDVICLSEHLVYDIREIYKQKPYIVNNGIRTITTPGLKKEAVKNEKIIILFLSNLIIDKGIFTFLDALEYLHNKQIVFEGTIVGKEAELSSFDLNAELSKRGLSSIVHYLGPKYGNEKSKTFSNSDIFVFPTMYRNETWGLVILEAMQAGLPVISTYEGAIPDIIDEGITGFLVEKNNSKLLADKIKVLIENGNLREEMGKTGRQKFLQKYTYEIFEKNMLNVFNKELEK